MGWSSAYKRVVLGVAVAGAVLAWLPSAMAAVPPAPILPDQTIQQFISNPDSLLSQYPNGGPDMVKAVQDLASSNPATLNVLVGLLGKANQAQATAIGTALGDVAKAAVTADPNYAAQIQVAVAVSNNTTALAAFNTVIGGDIQIAAVTGGVGGGGGGGPTNPLGGGSGGGGPNSPNLTTSVPNTPDSFSVPGLTGTSPGTLNAFVSP